MPRRCFSYIKLSLDLLASIASANTANEACVTLQKVCQGNHKIMVVKLQTLRQSLENLRIKNTEGVQDYITRVLELANQMKALGDTVPKAMVVGKLLRSLGRKFNHVVTAIEESKDLSKLTMDEVSGSLLAHEARLVRQVDDTTEKDEKALHIRGEVSRAKDHKKSSIRGGGRGFSQGRFHGRGRSRGTDNRQH